MSDEQRPARRPTGPVQVFGPGTAAEPRPRSSSRSRGKRPRSRRRPRRLTVAVLGAAALALLVVGGFKTTLFYRLLTHVIVVDDQVEEPADFIYVLNGAYRQRSQVAARLYQDGRAPRVLLPGTQEMAPATDHFPESPLSQRIASVIVEMGVPEDAVTIVPFPGGVVNTRDEAEALRLQVEREPVRRVIVVTTDYHTGRARRTIKRALRGLDVEVLMAAAPEESGLAPWNWWETKEGKRIYEGELLKQVAVVFGVTG